MDKEQVEQRTFDLFQNGYNCAEAISTAIVEWYGPVSAGFTPRVATAFGGGIGGTKCENCGALTGGLIALGWLFGRTEPGADKQDAYTFATEFRNKFLDLFGSTQCKAILVALGQQENLLKCKRMTGAAAGILFDILANERQNNPKSESL